MRKEEKLFQESLRDFEIKTWNKACSSLYFSVHKRLERILRSKLENLPRRDDKFANILRNLGHIDEALDFLLLYNARIKADYHDEEMTETEANRTLELGTKLWRFLETLESELG